MEATGEAADVYDVPGAFELPLAAAYLAATGRYAGVACLGAVIRGETDHYDYVCAEAARGIQDVQLRTGVPCAFGAAAGQAGRAGVSETARYAIAIGRFYEDLADRLISGPSAPSSRPPARPPTSTTSRARSSCRSRPPTWPPRGATRAWPASAR